MGLATKLWATNGIFWSVLGSMSIPKCGSSAHDSCGLKCGQRSTASNFPGPPCRFLSHFVCFPWTPLSPAEECCYRRQLAHEEQSRTPRDVFLGRPCDTGSGTSQQIDANRWFSVEKLGTPPGLDAESGIRQFPLCKHLDQFDLESLARLGKMVSSHDYISLSQHGRYCATQLHFYRRAIC